MEEKMLINAFRVISSFKNLQQVDISLSNPISEVDTNQSTVRLLVWPFLLIKKFLIMVKHYRQITPAI